MISWDELVDIVEKLEAAGVERNGITAEEFFGDNVELASKLKNVLMLRFGKSVWILTDSGKIIYNPKAKKWYAIGKAEPIEK